MDSIGLAAVGAVVPLGEKVLCALQALLPAAWIVEWYRGHGRTWRRRQWEPLTTVWACVYRALKGQVGVRGVEGHVDRLRDHPPESVCDGADFARARLRVPLELFEALLQRVGAEARARVRRCFGDLCPVLVDGTTCETFLTPANAESFGHSNNPRGPSHFPLLRLVLLVCAQSGAALDAALGAYAVSERGLFRELVDRLRPGSLLLGDRGFCSLLALWYLRQRGSHYLGRLHQARPQRRRKRNRILDYRCVWSHSVVRFTRCPAWLDLVPLVTTDLEVRIVECQVHRNGYRPVPLALCTTLLDADRYPAAELIRLYCGRWQIETALRHLKQQFGLHRLHSRTPDGVQRDALAALIAHNLLTQLVLQAGCAPARISLLRVCEAILDRSLQMSEASAARRAVLFQCLLAEIPRHPMPYQPRPPEPRALVTSPSRFSCLTISRAIWHQRHWQGTA